MSSFSGSEVITGSTTNASTGEIPPNNWLITPVPSPANESNPSTQSDQRWLLVLTGVQTINLPGNNAVNWRRETIYVPPNIVYPPLQYAIANYGIPAPAGYTLGFQLDQWAPFAAVSSVFAKEKGNITAGFAVDNWRLSPFYPNTGPDGNPVDRIFNGIEVDVAVVNNQAWLYSISYNITLLGKISFGKPDVIP